MNHSKTAKQYRAFVNCPVLWQSPSSPLPLFSLPWREYDLAEEEVSVAENVVFGKKMESFFSHAIYKSERYEMLAENVQIISDKVTLGELDFLLRDKETEQLIHVELACKFYLYDERRAGQNEYSAWVGPNQNDFLDRKIEKLKTKQLPLLHHPECRKWLVSELNITDTAQIIQQVYFPANLYLPFGKTDIPGNINTEAIKGFWLRPDVLKTRDFKSSKFFLTTKTDWLLEPTENTDWQSLDDTLNQVEQMHQRKKSPMVWIKSPEGRFRKAFVVWW